MKISQNKLLQIIQKHGTKCHYCGKDLMEKGQLCIDHKIPQSKGGTDDIENLVPCCGACNSRKGQKDYDIFVLQEAINAQLPEGSELKINETEFILKIQIGTKISDVLKKVRKLDI